MSSSMSLVTTGLANGLLAGLESLPVPAGVTLVPGGNRTEDLSFSLPPSVALDTHRPTDILILLNYAGIRYRSPDSFAATLGISTFESARNFAQTSSFDQVTFDWDHTLSNYKIVDDVWGVIKTKANRTSPPPLLARTPMIALEAARPFMQEIAFGMMVGYALRQGLKNFNQWEQYKPQVGLATHTWPDRIAVLAQHFIRLIPLMEGLLPGSPHMYNKIMDADTRSVVHLHDFLDYANRLLSRFDSGGFEALNAAEQDAVMAYLEDGKAHVRKPLGAFRQKGWGTTTLVHFDDSTKVIRDIERADAVGVRGIHVRQSHSSLFKDVQEWNKIAVSRLWTSPEAAASRSVRDLARMEKANSTLPAIVAALGALQLYPESAFEISLGERSLLPDGVLFTVHETPTTLGEFWNYYVDPTNRLKDLIRRLKEKKGGLKRIRDDYRSAVSRRRPTPQLLP